MRRSTVPPPNRNGTAGDSPTSVRGQSLLCLNKDGIAGLYDMTPGASKVFYTNDGSGDFEAVPVLIPEEGIGTVIRLI